MIFSPRLNGRIKQVIPNGFAVPLAARSAMTALVGPGRRRFPTSLDAGACTGVGAKPRPVTGMPSRLRGDRAWGPGRPPRGLARFAARVPGDGAHRKGRGRSLSG